MAHPTRRHLTRRRFLRLSGAAAAALAGFSPNANATEQEPLCVTQRLAGNNQLLYFTSSSLLIDDQHLVYISDRTGHPNLLFLNLSRGDDRQLTTNADGYLHSYVYFDGRPRRGLGKASISLDPQRGLVYYLQGHDICVADMQGKPRKISEIPADQVTAFTHVSDDGRRLCIPTTDARALDGYWKNGKAAYNIDQRVQEENLTSYLRVFDTRTGKVLLAEPVARSWITHVQFSPIDPEVILYNHEWPADCGIRRCWLWDGKQHIRLRDEKDGRSRKDWTCHEMWTRDGRSIIYHGTYDNGPAYIGKVELGDRSIVEISLPKEYRKYGHFTVSNTGLLVSDGYYQTPEDSTKGPAQWITLQKPDWEKKTIRWTALCRHRSNWDSQDSHPHPIYNHRADAVFFTSNVSGRRQVYRASVPGNL